MISISKAIQAINPNAEVSVNGEDFKQITWLNGTTPISKSDIEAKIAELKTAYDNNKYQRDRKPNYPLIAEQLDLLYHDIVADKLDTTGEWAKKIKAVK